MQVASPVPVSATPQQPTTASNSRKPPPAACPTTTCRAQGVAPAPAAGSTSAAVTTDLDHSRSQKHRRKQRQQSSPSGQRRSRRQTKHRKSRTPRRSSRDSAKQSRRQSRKQRSSLSKPRALSMDSRLWNRSPPAVVLRSHSAIHGRPRSLPQQDERQNRWHNRADQEIRAPPSSSQPYRVSTLLAAPGRRQQPAASFYLLD